MTSAES